MRGTNDMGTETDIVLYMVSEEREGKTYISTKKEKTRAMEFDELTWELHWEEGVPFISEVCHIDLDKVKKARKAHEADKAGIQLIKYAVRDGYHTRRGIQQYCHDRDQSERQTGRILGTYKLGHGIEETPVYWRVIRGKKNNADYYELLPPVTVITPLTPVYSGNSENTG